MEITQEQIEAVLNRMADASRMQLIPLATISDRAYFIFTELEMIVRDAKMAEDARVQGEVDRKFAPVVASPWHRV